MVHLASPALWRHLRRLHDLCALTLAPSSAAIWTLAAHGIGPVRRWARGVDTQAFDPAHRRAGLRRRYRSVVPPRPARVEVAA